MGDLLMTLARYISKPTWLHEEYEERKEVKRMTTEEMSEKVEEVFDRLGSAKQISIFNEYCDRNNYFDSYIYEMDMIDEVLRGDEPSDILWWAEGNDFHAHDPYFKFDGNDLESTDYPLDWIYEYDLINYMVNNEESFGENEIQEIFDECEEEEKEED